MEELGRLVALESEKLAHESRVEASILADTFAYFGGLVRTQGEQLPIVRTLSP